MPEATPTPLTFKGIPVHACDKAPRDKPYLIDPRPGSRCPFCGVAFSAKPEQPRRTIPAGIWVTVQGVPVQLSAPLEVSEEDWQRIHARMPTRDRTEE